MKAATRWRFGTRGTNRIRHFRDLAPHLFLMTSLASCLLLTTVPAPLRFAVFTREASYGTTRACSLLLVALHFV